MDTSRLDRVLLVLLILFVMSICLTLLASQLVDDFTFRTLLYGFFSWTGGVVFALVAIVAIMLRARRLQK